jgi:TetR/AcrR family transcriptional repressor of mexJK operon
MTTLTKETRPDKVEARRQAILDVAKDLFLTQGYAATSMSEIATRVGGSKGTLYNYFRSKEELFGAFMVDVCQGPANVSFQTLPPIGGDFRGALVGFGASFLSFLMTEPTMAIHRLVVAECGRFPELGRIFYETGPQRGEQRLEAYFREAMVAGNLRPGEPLSAARWFRDLVLADIYSRALWGVLGEVTPEDIHKHAEEAADIFLAAFGTEGAGDASATS